MVPQDTARRVERRASGSRSAAGPAGGAGGGDGRATRRGPGDRRIDASHAAIDDQPVTNGRSDMEPGPTAGAHDIRPRPQRNAPAPRAGSARAPGRRDLARDAAVLFGLAGVAITQPLLDLFGDNPTFFVAGNYGRRQIVVFAVVTAVAPALLTFLATALPGLALPRAARALHGVGVAGLAALFGLVLCRTLGIDAMPAAVAVALVLGVAVALAERMLTPVRSFLGYLAVGNLAFLALFLLASPSADLLRGVAYAGGGNVRVPPLDGPVVVIVLDEFPLTALVRPDGTINDQRYPNIAALAGWSTWFRNAVAESEDTMVSVPSILTGLQGAADDLPTYRDHPDNLFTMLGNTRYPVRRYEAVTDLCPPDTCEPEPPQPLRQALSDASLVYAHRALPARLRDGLAPVDQGWGNFGEQVRRDVAADAPASPPDGAPRTFSRERKPQEERGRHGQAYTLRRELLSIGPEPALNVVHVLLPHHPYELTPWNTMSTDTWLPGEMPEPDEPGYERAFAELYGLQALQIGAVDRIIGEFMRHMERQGAWDDAMIVVTSDHGVEISPPGFTRLLDETTRDEVLRIPLFVKAPGQTTGVVQDDPASTVDVAPTIVDLLDIETDWEFDGRSLLDGSGPRRGLKIDTSLDKAFEVAERQQARFPRGDGWAALASIGTWGDLVGTEVADLRIGEPSALRWTLDHRDTLAAPADAGDGPRPLPILMTGQVHGSDDPPELVIALNGTIAGTVGGYRESDGGVAFTGLMGPFFVEGDNRAVAYEVERTPGGPVLHPLAER